MDEEVQDSCYQFINYVLSHLVAAGTLDSILALNFDKWSCSDASMDAIAHRIASISSFLEPIMMRELDRASKKVGSERPSNSYDHRSVTLLPMRTTSDSESHSCKEKSRAGSCCAKTRTEKGCRCRSRRHNSPEDINRRR